MGSRGSGGREDAALTLARRVHADQVDKSGSPYVEHCIRVAAKCGDEKARVVALLHDVLEDTPTPKDALRSQFGDEIVDAVVALTRQPGESPEDYYARVRNNSLGLRVKLADLHDNLEPSRLSQLDQETVRWLLRKYGKAYIALSVGEDSSA